MLLKSNFIKMLLSRILTKVIRKKLGDKDLDFYIRRLDVDDVGDEKITVEFSCAMTCNKSDLTSYIFDEVMK